MKRLLFSLMIAGGLALMAAPQARAQSICGTNDAALMTGGLTSETTDGPVTGAAGVGALQFGTYSLTGGAGGAPGCAVTGELIYNAGDIQTAPAGVFFGPSNCYSGLSGFGGAPCFDGGSNGNTAHDVAGFLTAGGPAGSYILTFAANYTYFDTYDTYDLYGAIPFGFFVENTMTNGAIGESIYPAEASVTTDTPVLVLALQKQTLTPVPTAFGAAPFLGEDSLICAGYGANSGDAIAAAQALPTNSITGAFGTTLGSFNIFNALQADGELSFNSNSNYYTSPPSPIPNNLFCPFALVPGNYLGAGYANSAPTAAAIFPDGAANFISSLEVATPAGALANPNCTDLATDGAGYSDSSVQWGATNQNAYVIVTALVGTATGFVPPGEMSYCIAYRQGAGSAFTYKSTNPAASTGTTTYGAFAVTNKNEAACDTETSMATASATGAYSNGLTGSKLQTWNTTCTLTLAGGSPFVAGVVGPNPLAQTVAATTCTCTCTDTGTWTGACSAAKPTAFSVTSPLSITSTACPISDGPVTVTCKN